MDPDQLAFAKECIEICKSYTHSALIRCNSGIGFNIHLC